eukprot:6231595-Amphidinium_carterae.1
MSDWPVPSVLGSARLQLEHLMTAFGASFRLPNHKLTPNGPPQIWQGLYLSLVSDLAQKVTPSTHAIETQQ